MGFGGGNTGSLPDHDHDPLVSNDGGTLNANATSFNLSSGSILYSDGSNIQELAVGSASDELRVSGASIPEWFTPGAASSTWTEEANITLGSPGTLQASGLSHYDLLNVYIRAANVAAQPTGITFNSEYTGTQYSSRYLTDFTTDEDNASVSNIYINGTNNTTSWWNIWMYIWNIDGQEKTCTWTAMLDKGTGNQSLGASFGCAKTTFTTDISSIEKVNLSTGQVVNQQTGSRMVVLGASP